MNGRVGTGAAIEGLDATSASACLRWVSARAAGTQGCRRPGTTAP